METKGIPISACNVICVCIWEKLSPIWSSWVSVSLLSSHGGAAPYKWYCGRKSSELSFFTLYCKPLYFGSPIHLESGDGDPRDKRNFSSICITFRLFHHRNHPRNLTQQMLHLETNSWKLSHGGNLNRIWFNLKEIFAMSRKEILHAPCSVGLSADETNKYSRYIPPGIFQNERFRNL